jgi:hypothetical protein
LLEVKLRIPGHPQTLDMETHAEGKIQYFVIELGQNSNCKG